MKVFIQKLLELFCKGAHKQKYGICSDKHYCTKCHYASDICMYGEEPENVDTTTPCADAFIRKLLH